MSHVFAVVAGFVLALVGYRIFRGDPAGEAPEALQTIITNQEAQMASIDEILEGVAELDSIDASLDQVFAKLQELIEAGKQDPAKLQQALDAITAHKDRLKAEIVENTVAADEDEDEGGGDA